MRRISFQVEGDDVRGALWQPPGSVEEKLPLVVMIHGMNTSRVEWYQLPEQVASKGFSVLAFDLRCHGESDGRPRGLVSIARARKDVQGAIEYLRQRHGVDVSRTALVGHSLGAAIAIEIAEDLPEVRTVVAMAPPGRLSREMPRLNVFVYSLLDKLNLLVRIVHRDGFSVPYPMDYERLYASRASVERARADGFLVGKVPIRNYGPLMRRLNADDAAKRLTKPTLMLIAEMDVVVAPWNSRRVYANLAAKQRRLVVVPRSGHSMAGDHMSKVVGAHITGWLQRQLRDGPDE